MNQSKRTVDQLVGDQVRAFREGKGWSQEALAARLRAIGLYWPRSVIAAIETGRREISLAEFLLLCRMFGRRPAEWFEGIEDAEWLELSDESSVQVLAVRNAFSGKGEWVADYAGEHLWDTPATQPPTKEGDWAAMDLALRRLDLSVEQAKKLAYQWWPLSTSLRKIPIVKAARWAIGEAENNVAGKLKTKPFVVSLLAYRLWDKSLTEERDVRVDERAPEASQRERQAIGGHVTRELIDELSAALQNANSTKSKAGVKRRKD